MKMSILALDAPTAILIKIDHKEPLLGEDWSIPIPSGDVTFTTVY